ncbi:MAG: DUF4190 domain-containing protein [Pirellulaceae bacterium]|nr:DUF4190 domain-containing protein [Pirellulaceae bacterium]
MPISFTCPHCGRQTNVADQYVGQTGPCSGCGQSVTILAPGTKSAAGGLGDDALLRMVIPVGRSGWAIAAGYAGLFSLLFVCAPISLILGIIAIVDLRKHPEKHGWGRAIFGLVMGSIFSLIFVAMLLIGVFAGGR